MTDKPVAKRSLSPTQRAAQAVYSVCYAPADLQELMVTAEGRSRIRRLPVAQFFFGLKQIPPGERTKLLPHVTEEQWMGALDLDLWSADEADDERFLYWQAFLLEAEDAVARKLLRGTDPQLWQLVFKRQLTVDVLTDLEAPRPGSETEEGFETPDQNFWITLPDDPDRARLLKALIFRLYELDQIQATLMLSSSLSRTTLEIEEEAYQERRNRTEDLGFQDYFDAVEIYSPIEPGSRLAEKSSKSLKEVQYPPVPVAGESGGLLLVQAVSRLEPSETQAVLEELFFCCNKVLSADKISSGNPSAVQHGVRKALAGINLGLDWWAEGDLAKALEGIRRHYLQSFFQLGRGLLLRLQRRARQFEPEPGSYEETIIDALLEPQPRQSVVDEDGSIRPEWISTRGEYAELQSFLE